ncbi:MAG: tetratricopeptide repeat protein [Opitutaceae bacterium]
MAPSSPRSIGAAPPAPASDRRYTARWLGALLFCVAFGAFLPALRNDFVTYDDPAYVIENPHVSTGLSWANFRWAWTSFEHSNWHPLTWLSHQLDCALFGLAPWGHHLTNILLHAASALLLFVVLQRATARLWRSLVVAALFSLHPLRVESVAWIAERKDVLSTLLGLLALWAYVAYAQRAHAARPRAWSPYGLSLLAFAASLTAKPMLVTLPCALLLLDLWPLDRWHGGALRSVARLVFEKLPFFALAAVSCVLTSKAQAAGGAMQAIENFSLPVRAANALVAYSLYLGKLVWPSGLAVLYPNFGEMPPPAHIAGAALLLVALSTAALVAWRAGRPWALVGWLWFLGTLVPVIGLVQVGGQTMADRYSYFPSIGALLVLVWVAAETSLRLPRRTIVLGAVALAAVLACGVLTARQVARWRNSVTLFQHTLAVTRDNWMAHFNLFLAYRRSPETAELARVEYARTLEIIAGFSERQNQRGLALLDRAGRLDEAIACFRKAVRVKKDNAAALLNLGTALLRRADGHAEAVEVLRAARRHQPESPAVARQLGRALAQEAATRDEGIYLLRTALWQFGDDAALRLALADALGREPRRRDEAIGEYERVLQLDPANAEAKAGLAVLQRKP